MTITVNAVHRRVQFTGNGSNLGPFSFSFKVLAAGDIKVSEGTTEKTVTTHYTTSLNADGTGSVTFTSGNAPANNAIVTIESDQAIERTSDFQTGGDFTASAINDDLDRLTINDQQIETLLSRNVQLPATVNRTTSGTGTSGPLFFPYADTASDQANKLIAFDSNGTALETTTGKVNSVSVSNVPVSGGASQAATVSFTASTGALALGIPVGSTGAVGPQGPQGNAGSDGDDGDDGSDGVDSGLSYTFSATTSDSDPGAGQIRFNNATLSSVTELYIDDSSTASGNPDVSAFILTWDDSTTTGDRGQITITKKSATQNFVVFKIDDATVDATGYCKIQVAHVLSAGAFSDSDAVSIAFARTGNTGSTGTAATIAVGSTTTGSPGSSASVANSGSSSAATFNFTIPRGDVGAQGPQGNAGSDGDDGSDGADGDDGFGGFPYTFSTTTSDADPGAGQLRLNNGTLGSVTQIFIDDTTAASGNPDISAFILTWDDSTQTSDRGQVTIVKKAAQQNFAVFKIDDASVDATGYVKLNVAHVTSAGSFSNSDAVLVSFARTGDQGSASGSLAIANNLSDLNNASTARSNLGVAIGSNVQAHDADLDAIAALAKTDSNFIVGNGSTWVAENAATARTSLGLGTAATAASSAFETADSDILKADTADELTAGFSSATEDAGTKSSGTFTPDPDDGNFQHFTNGGAHTLGVPAKNCTMVLLQKNNASAGTLTTSGFTKVDGDDLTTTNGHEFFLYITRYNDGSTTFSALTVKALQ